MYIPISKVCNPTTRDYDIMTIQQHPIPVDHSAAAPLCSEAASISAQLVLLHLTEDSVCCRVVPSQFVGDAICCSGVGDAICCSGADDTHCYFSAATLADAKIVFYMTITNELGTT